MRSVFHRRETRATELLVASLSLALPASALALSHDTTAGPPTRDQLAVHLDARHLRLGQRASLTGQTARSQFGRRVVLESREADATDWRVLASVRIGARGRFGLRARLARSSQLRAVELTTPRGASSRPRPHVGGPRRAAPGERSAPAAPAAPAATVAAVSQIERVQVAARLTVARRERAVIAGQRLMIAGHLLPGRSGRRVTVQARAGRGWHTLAAARTGRRGGFAVRWSPADAAGDFLRVVFAGDRFNAHATAAAGPIRLFAPTVASWYSDAGETACGFHAGYGVANRTLPCGTRVAFRHAGRMITATVDDRGPYVGGRDYDLNENTAAALGFAGVGVVEASVD